ncbi:MAG: hypothetical protein J0H43_06625 [Actinobacteria bacterium]|nr:hypothetical protein [Actinomycetota bacterium]
MKLERAYVRFFRSFNFDYELKARPGSHEREWDRTDLGWYPYVRLDVDPRITAVVGANESGKSHLLDAVERLLTATEVDRQDFCRCSDLYSVEQGERRVSDFAGRFRVETDADAALMTSLGYPGGQELHYVRAGEGKSFTFTPTAPELRLLTAAEETELRGVSPAVFRLETEVALPASMSIRRLADQSTDSLPSRSGRRDILGSLPKADAPKDTIPTWWDSITNAL